MVPAALGFSVHTGYAHAVAVIEDDPGIAVVHRAKIALWDPPDPEAAQAYHRAADLPRARAAASIAADRQTAAKIATRSLREIATALAARDCVLVAARIVDKPRAALPALESILASHPLLHAAEGVMYREIAAAAAGALCDDVAEVDADWLGPRAAKLGLRHTKVAQQIALAGGAVGPPWTKEHGQCALAGWIALLERARR